MAIFYDTNRYRTKGGKKYYLSINNDDMTAGKRDPRPLKKTSAPNIPPVPSDYMYYETYSVHSFTMNSDFDSKTGTLIYTEKLRGLKKGSTDDLINDNADLIDSYGSLDFINTVRSQIIKEILK